MEKIRSDLLIVGGGISGAICAIRAIDFSVDVTVVDKAFFGRSGCSPLASGVFGVFLPEDNLSEWVRETVEEPASSAPYLMNQKLLLTAIPKSYFILQKMENWGVKWIKENGKIKRMRGTGQRSPRNAMLAESGPQMMDALSREAIQRGVRVVNRVMITDLLTSDGKAPTKGSVVGAIGFHTRTGEIYVFEAKATVLCCGAWSLPEKMPQNLYGDGIAAGLRVGAELGNMDIPSIGIRPAGFKCAPGMHMFFGLGAKLLNGNGERFMYKYDHERLELAQRFIVGLAVEKEYREGRGPVVLDVRHFTAEKWNLVKATIPLVIETFESAGFNLTKDTVPYVAEFFSRIGGHGIQINAKGETSISGLYAAGDNSDLASLNFSALTQCSLTGFWAGENAAEYALQNINSKLNTSQIAVLEEKILKPSSAERRLQFEEVYPNVFKLYQEQVGIYMQRDRLEAGLIMAEEIFKRDVPQLSAQEPHELSKVLGLGNLVEVLIVIIAAALRRHESRGPFVREDYPETDNLNWLRRIVAKKTEGGLEINESRIPMEEFYFKPKSEKELHPIFKC